MKRAEGPRALYGSIICYVFLSIRQLLAVSSTEAMSVQHIKQSSEELCCSVFLDAFLDINHVDALQHISAIVLDRRCGVDVEPTSASLRDKNVVTAEPNRSIGLAASQKLLKTETIMCPASLNVALICLFQIKIIVIVDLFMKQHDVILESWIYFK